MKSFELGAKDFLQSVEQIKANSLEIIDKLPEGKENLKETNAFDLFLNDVVIHELAEELRKAMN